MGLYSKYIFPHILDWAMSRPEVQQYRRQALAPAHGDVLEIGFGTGLNMPYYPERVTNLTAIDSQRMLPDRVNKRIAEARLPVEQIQLDAGKKLPFDDGSFDCVVTTWTLCSIDRVASALTEINRVLKPEGQLIFIEHGRSDDPKVARLQDLLNPIQNIIGCGCNLNRPIDRLITEAGMEMVELDRFLMPATPRILGETYRGVARRGKNHRARGT